MFKVRQVAEAETGETVRRKKEGFEVKNYLLKKGLKSANLSIYLFAKHCLLLIKNRSHYGRHKVHSSYSLIPEKPHHG